jgi:hypothetical protein
MAQLESNLRALAAEVKRSEGFAGWLTGSTQHAEVKAAVDAALLQLQQCGAAASDGDSEVRAAAAPRARSRPRAVTCTLVCAHVGLAQVLARPFLLACAARNSSLCALGFTALEQLAASDALSEESTGALADALAQVCVFALRRARHVRARTRAGLPASAPDVRTRLTFARQVNDDDEEQTQLKALQTTLTVLQSHHGPATDASVSAVVVTGFRLLSGTQPTNAVHATAAATLRQVVSVLLARAREDARTSSRALALVRVLCSLARGAASAAPDLAAPLPRAFAVDLLDDALRNDASLFSAAPAFNELLLLCVFPLLEELLSSDAAVGAARGARLSAGALHGVAPSASALADEVGYDAAEVAECRCAFRTAATAACTYAQSLPQRSDALLERVLAASQSSSTAPWYRAAALDALQRCAADQRVARALVEAAPATPRVTMLSRMSDVAADVLTDAFGAEAVRHHRLSVRARRFVKLCVH